jgi:hypothetical protein
MGSCSTGLLVDASGIVEESGGSFASRELEVKSEPRHAAYVYLGRVAGREARTTRGRDKTLPPGGKHLAVVGRRGGGGRGAAAMTALSKCSGSIEGPEWRA